MSRGMRVDAATKHRAVDFVTSGHLTVLQTAKRFKVKAMTIRKWVHDKKKEDKQAKPKLNGKKAPRGTPPKMEAIVLLSTARDLATKSHYRDQVFLTCMLALARLEQGDSNVEKS